MIQNVLFYDLGTSDYKDCWDLQERLFKETIDLKLSRRDHPDAGLALPSHHLIFTEHPHVFTLGKSGNPEHLLLDQQALHGVGATYYAINRGGDITYHGPGQIVGYPIFDLEQFFTDIHKYMRYLEEAIILTLAEYGITAGRVDGLTGVWLDGDHPGRARKIAAMGVKCSRWVTMHGFAFNVNADLDYFGYIVPCGIQDKAVTSMDKELGRKLDFEEVKSVLKEKLSEVFEINLQDLSPGTIASSVKH